VTIELSPDLQQALDDAAREQGTTPQTLAAEWLRERLFPTSSQAYAATGPRNLAERLAGYVGVLDSGEHFPGGAQMSERTGEQFTDILVQRREQGRL
jgi:predicted transcriptional regulator